MLPQLTTNQKTQIYSWLKEARELAMDEGSSEKNMPYSENIKDGSIIIFLLPAIIENRKGRMAERIKEREATKKQTQ
jgi:hypothetical protein